MNSVPPCEDLAPYLRQKLTQDKEHSWQNAPYIHEEVRAALQEAEYASKPIPAYAQVYQRSEYLDCVNVGGRYMENIQVQKEPGIPTLPCSGSIILNQIK